MNRFISAVIAASLLLLLSSPAYAEKNIYGNLIPENGFVPDKETACKIAEAILIRIYDKKEIAEELPLIASLNKGVWVVKGTWNKGGMTFGGVAEVHISKKTGEIILVTHGM